jgi:hypothetical protein
LGSAVSLLAAKGDFVAEVLAPNGDAALEVEAPKGDLAGASPPARKGKAVKCEINE